MNPADRDAEQAVLGALLLYGEPHHVKRLEARGLRAKHFYWDGHAAAFEAALTLSQRAERVDPITVAAELERLGKRAALSSQDLDRLCGCVPAAGNIELYARRVTELAIWRGRLTLSHWLVHASSQRDREQFERFMARLQRSIVRAESDSSETGQQLTKIIHTNFETGEIVREETQAKDCPNCQHLQDQLKGAEKDIKAWRTRHANLLRDKEAEAQKDALWLVGQALFDLWRMLGKHPRSQFTYDRFEKARPFIRNPKYGPEVCERGVVGITFDPYITTRLNGTKKRHDDWDLLFRSADRLEEYANRAPLDFKPTLTLVPQAEKPKLRAVEGGAS